ncbi:hypothetical protein CB1_000832018 [Camelus ferus]|nr:hypothetical protein CB1_000832018 [Camelus ferus]
MLFPARSQRRLALFDIVLKKGVLLFEFRGHSGEREGSSVNAAERLLRATRDGCAVTNRLPWTVLRPGAAQPSALPVFSAHQQEQLATTVQNFMKEKCPIKTQI